MATVEVLETNQTVEISETSQTVNVQSGVPDATSIDGTPVDAANPSSGDVLRYDGSGWSVKAEADLDPTSLDASNLTAGSIADARVQESNVTQHEGAIDHDALLNYLADQHRTVLIDTEGNRPAAGTSDRFFYATDTDRWFYDDGGSWNALTMDAGDIDSGTLADARVPESAVTQHEGALSIGGAQVDSGTLPDARIQESGVTQHEGAVDHDALTNFSADEHRPLLVDTKASRPAAGTADRFFWATDEQKLYRDTGSTWNVAAAEIDGSDVTSGTLPDARVAESSVTQHEPFNADQLQGETLPSSPSDGELLRYNGTQWEHASGGSGIGEIRHVRDFGAGVNKSASANATAIQDAIDDAPEGGVVELPPVGLEIDSPPSIDKRLTFRGVSFTTGDRTLLPMHGSHLIVKTAGAHGVELSLSKEAVNLRDFGVKFDSGLSSTGHGIFCDAPRTAGSRGIMQAEWRNLAVIQHDGDHYAYNIVNPQLLDCYGLRWSGGGGFAWINDHPDINFGNSNVFGGWGQTVKTGSVHALFFNGIDHRMNFVHHFGIDPRATAAVDETTQKMIEYTGNVADIGFFGGNFESPNNAKINLPPGGAFNPTNLSGVDIEAAQTERFQGIARRIQGTTLYTRDDYVSGPGGDSSGYVQITDDVEGTLKGLRTLNKNTSDTVTGVAEVAVGAQDSAEFQFEDEGGTLRGTLAMGDGLSGIRWYVGSVGGFLRSYGMNLQPQDSAPSSPENGDMAYADGTNWDPAGDGSEGLFVYVNGSWMATNATT